MWVQKYGVSSLFDVQQRWWCQYPYLRALISCWCVYRKRIIGIPLHFLLRPKSLQGGISYIVRDIAPGEEEVSCPQRSLHAFSVDSSSLCGALFCYCILLVCCSTFIWITAGSVSILVLLSHWIYLKGACGVLPSRPIYSRSCWQLVTAIQCESLEYGD